MKKNSYLSAQYLIQLTIGLYFFISGLLGIIGFNSGANQLLNDFNKLTGNSNYLPLIISICFLVAGLILVGGLFLSLKNSVIYLIIFIVWIVYIIYTHFTDNLLKPELLIWLRGLSSDLIILTGLWGSIQKK